MGAAGVERIDRSRWCVDHRTGSRSGSPARGDVDVNGDAVGTLVDCLPCEITMAGSPLKKARHIERLREIGIETLLEDVADGLLYRDIATKHGVSYSALTAFFYEDENRALLTAARKAGARAHVEIALSDAEAEQDPRMAGLQKLRADMRLHLARADDSETWGEKKNVQVTGQLDVQAMHLVAVSRTPRVLPGRSTAALPASGDKLLGSGEPSVTQVIIEEITDAESGEAGTGAGWEHDGTEAERPAD